MKTKEEQLEELKATAVELQRQIEALEKPEQWEPKGYIVHPSEIKARRTHWRTLAYVREYGSDWEADWEDKQQAKYYVYYRHTWNTWCVSSSYECCIDGAIYMSQDCVVGLRDKLNSGEVVL